MNRSVEMIKCLRKLIQTENTLAREKKKNHSLSRDEVDLLYAKLVDFTVKDCNEVLRLIERKS